MIQLCVRFVIQNSFCFNRFQSTVLYFFLFSHFTISFLFLFHLESFAFFYTTLFHLLSMYVSTFTMMFMFVNMAKTTLCIIREGHWAYWTNKREEKAHAEDPWSANADKYEILKLLFSILFSLDLKIILSFFSSLSNYIP